MTTYTGWSLLRGFLDGAMVNPNPICIFPHQPMPTRYQWGVWRTFLMQHFVCSNLVISPSFDPTQRVHQSEQHPAHVSMFSRYLGVLQQVPTGMPIGEVISKLPSFFQCMLTGFDSIWTPRNVEHLKFGILNGCIEAATDGSLQQSQNRGSLGVMISIQDDRESLIGGGARCPDSPCMSSLTTEHYGLLSLGIILHLIVKW